MNRIITLTLIALLVPLIISGCATNLTTMTNGDTKVTQRSISIGGKQKGKGEATYNAKTGDLTINGNADQDATWSPEQTALLLKLLTPTP